MILKTLLLDLVIADVTAQLENSLRGQKEAMDEAASHKGAMASRYDTFKEEAQYLAGGYGTQILTLQKMLDCLNYIKAYPPTICGVAVFSLVEVEFLDTDSTCTYFLLPAGGGNEYQVQGKEITILSINAPVALALTNKVTGDEIDVRLPSGQKTLRILSLC